MYQKIIFGRVLISFGLTSDLVNELKDNHLDLKLPELPSNSIRSQLWCILGARKSYTQAILHSDWQGFSSPLEKSDGINIIIAKLMNSEILIKELSDTELSEIQINYLLDLLEHEIQHHGQLIRYFYGNGLEFPESWNERYTV